MQNAHGSSTADRRFVEFLGTETAKKRPCHAFPSRARRILYHACNTPVYRPDDQTRKKTRTRYTLHTTTAHYSGIKQRCAMLAFLSCPRSRMHGKRTGARTRTVGTIRETKRSDPVYSVARVHALSVILEERRSTLVAARGGNTIKRALLRVYSGPTSTTPQPTTRR